MKAALFIPCFNEGTQKTPVILNARESHEIERHVIGHTLQLLRNKIVSGVFSRVIIYDDWSTDDTLEEVRNFQKQLWQNSSLFQILMSPNNVGKAAWFLDALSRARKLWDDRIVLTDADMHHVGGNTFEKLAGKDDLFLRTHEGASMLVSHQGEFVPSACAYSISGALTSGTRSLNIEDFYVRLLWLGLREDDFRDAWYGLESFLNHVFASSFGYVNKPKIESTPLFSPAFRKGRSRQKTDIINTVGKWNLDVLW